MTRTKELIEILKLQDIDPMEIKYIDDEAYLQNYSGDGMPNGIIPLIAEFVCEDCIDDQHLCNLCNFRKAIGYSLTEKEEIDILRKIDNFDSLEDFIASGATLPKMLNKSDQENFLICKNACDF